MNGYIIRKHLSDKMVKVGDIATGVGVTQSAVSQVIHGKSRSKKIEKAVADAIDRPVAEVFPDKEAA